MKSNVIAGVSCFTIIVIIVQSARRVDSFCLALLNFVISKEVRLRDLRVR